MMRLHLLLPILILPLTGGCIRTVASVATAPFKAAGQVADWTTTSQDEADRNYGREARKREAREGKERKAWQTECNKRPDNCQPYDGYLASDPG